MSKLYFSQIREDSVVEKSITQAMKPKNIVVIGSGGCTAFSILDDEVQHVFCVDSNPAQCALIELKKAAIHSLDRPDYLAFIGEAPSNNRLLVYQQLSIALPSYAQKYWECHQNGIEMGVNQCGVTERFYRFIGQNICHNLYGRDIWEQLLAANRLEDQQSFFQQYLTSPVWKAVMRVLLSKTTHLQFFPAFMFAHASEHDFGNYFLAQFEKEITTKSVANNYFISQILFSSYLYNKENGSPPYLTEEGYHMTKRNLAKLSIIPQRVQDFLNYDANVAHDNNTLHPIDAFYFSNLFDWADEANRMEICQRILAAKSKHAVLLFRQMLSVQILPDFFTEKLQVDQELSERCLELERSMVYQNITVGRLL